MKKALLMISVISTAMVMTASCTKFLTEHPRSFSSPDDFFHSEEDMKMAVDGLYVQGDQYYDMNNLASFYYTDAMGSPLIFTELLAGYGEPTNGAGSVDSGMVLPIREENGMVEAFWKKEYAAVQACSSAIKGITNSDAEVSEDVKNYYLGQAYFIRALHYFHLVQLWGPIPFTKEPTIDLSNSQVSPTAVADVYAGIIEDLLQAEKCYEKQSWTKSDGRVTKGAIKALLAKVYLAAGGRAANIAGSYQKAYEKANEVIDSGVYSLGTYEDLRDVNMEWKGEIIFALSRTNASLEFYNLFHSFMLPYPYEVMISEKQSSGGYIAPTSYFFASYDTGDLRIANDGYYFTHYPAKDGSGEVEFGRPFIRKYFDETALGDGLSALDVPIIRYADILLVAAEAKVMADGGTTSDADALDAYFQIHDRAIPNQGKPSSLNFETVYKERVQEMAFEGTAWYDIVRTGKVFNPITGKVVNVVGYQDTTHNRPFEEGDLLLPYPLRDKRLNPNLVRK